MLERARLGSHVRVGDDRTVSARRVGAYAALSVLAKSAPLGTLSIKSRKRSGLRKSSKKPLRCSSAAIDELERLRKRFVSFAEAGCAVRVGPAFGHPAFKVPLCENELDRRFLVPLVSGADISVQGGVKASGRAVFA